MNLYQQAIERWGLMRPVEQVDCIMYWLARYRHQRIMLSLVIFSFTCGLAIGHTCL